MNMQEGYNLDFKRNTDGLRTKDLVAFANSRYGGTIILGVEESETPSGLQRGRITGCAVNDEEKVKILNKAQSCIPAIDLAIIIENTSKKPIIRIEIPCGKERPYCTSEGVYMIRGDGRNNPLTPAELLDIFLEVQGRKFLDRFNFATGRLETNLKNTGKQFASLQNSIDGLKADIENNIGNLKQHMKSYSGDINYKFNFLISSYRMLEMIYNNTSKDIEHAEDIFS